MAYAKINQALNQDEDKQNLFGGKVDSQQDSGGVPGSQNEVKSSIEGQLAPGGGTAQLSAPKQESVEGQAGSREVFKRAFGKQEKPSAFAGIEKSIADSETGLQANLDKYSKEQGEKNFGYDNANLDKAIGGDDTEYSNAVNYLGQQYTKPEEFSAGNVGNEDLANLQAGGVDQGLTNMFRRQAGPEYSAGEAALDVASAKGSKDFQKTLDALLARDAALRERGVNESAALNKTTVEEQKAKLLAGQEGAKKYLGGVGTGIESQNQAEATAFNKKLADLKIKPNTLSPEEYKKAKELASAGVTDQSLLRFIEDQKFEAGDYRSFANEAKGSDFYDESEANKYNKLMALLNTGKTIQAGTAPTDVLQSYDINKLAKDIGLKATDKENKQRIRGKTSSDALIAKAKEAAAKRNEEFKNKIYGDEELAAMKTDLLKQGYSSRVIDEAINNINREDYVKRPGDWSWENALSEDEVALLNTNLRDADSLDAGKYKYDPKAQSAIINRDQMLIQLNKLIRDQSAKQQRIDTGQQYAVEDPTNSPDNIPLTYNGPALPQYKPNDLNEQLREAEAVNPPTPAPKPKKKGASFPNILKMFRG